MQIQELQDNSKSAKLLALARFLLGRADDTDAVKTIKTDSFVSMAQSLGININAQQLIQQAQSQPLNKLIKSVNRDKITFVGAETEPEAAMPVDQAEKTVEKMAKRAMKK